VRGRYEAIKERRKGRSSIRRRLEKNFNWRGGRIVEQFGDKTENATVSKRTTSEQRMEGGVEDAGSGPAHREEIDL